MAEARPTSPAAGSAEVKGSVTGFELSLERGGACVRLADQPVAPGLRLDLVVLAVPDVKFPFPIGQGSGQFRHRLCDLVRLEISAEPALALEAASRADLAALGLEGLQLAFREGFAELSGRIAAGPAFTLEAGLAAEGEHGLAVVFHSPCLFAPAPLSAAALPHLARRALAAAGAAPALADPLAPLLRAILAPRGWKAPRKGAARLARAEIAPGTARLAWERDPAGPAALPAQPALLAAAEGARTFREAEALLERGEPARARDAYLAAGAAASSHPFAAERLLSLLCLDERFHDEALDLASEWLSRRPDFVPALAAEAWVRVARAEDARASRALAAIAAAAAARGAGFSALAAAEACFALPGADRESALRAVDAALAVRRDHLPALRALRALASASNDREALLRANRRLVAYAPGDAEKARAHAELGEQLLATDPPAARLHLDQALRLAPEDEGALAALARACAAAGEPLRAVRALDRLRELHQSRGARGAAAAAALEAGALWEERLSHDENALLRYREACDLAPDADAHARAARVAERLGHWTEAADHHAAVLAGLDLAAPGARELAARTHVALGDVSERRLGDPAGAATHLEAAVALAPGDAAPLRRLAALYRDLKRPPDLLAALDRLAPLLPPAERGPLLAEVGTLALELSRPDVARSRLAAALAIDERSRPALEGLARLAANRGDAQAEREALSRLLPLAVDREEEAGLQERLAGACERAGDLAGAARAIAAARRAAPTLPRLVEAVRLARRGADPVILAGLLAELAAAARAAGDVGAASAAWLERGRILSGSDPALALAAVAEARALAPGDPGVLRVQAELGERSGDALLALGALRALAATGPGDAALIELRAARAALAAGEAAAARDHAERAVRAGAPGAGELLADVLERAGDDPGRADLLERLGRHAEAARLWERAGQPGRARAALEIAGADPASAPDVLGRLAELRLADGDAEGAAAAFVRLARIRGGREGALLALRAHGIVPSSEALDAAIACDPGLLAARAERALRRGEEDPRAGLADCEAALAGGLEPERRPPVLRLAARLALALDDLDGARRHLSAYCAEVPADDGALAELARLHREAGADGDLSLVLGRRLALAQGDDAVAVRLELASLLSVRPSRIAEAARLVREALALDPSGAAPLRAALPGPVGEALAPAERLELLARLAAHPDATPAEAGEALAERARALARAGDAGGALAAAREAARHGEPSDAGLELLARLSTESGDPAGAARALLARAASAVRRGDVEAAGRLAEAALAADAAGLDEAHAALREAAARTDLDRESARAVWEALAAAAIRAGDGAAEREALLALVPLVPTGERPPKLLRAAALALAAGDGPGARAAAEEARTLAPRDPDAARACADAARAAGDEAALAERLGDLAALAPPDAGTLLLERARILARLAAPAEADAAWAEALRALPPDRALAAGHARLRLAARLRDASAPLEAFARRAGDPAVAADALRTAAAVAVAAGDLGAALRCARRAHARTREDPAFAGPLLARILYLRGALGEALVLHRTLFERDLAGIEPEEAAVLSRQLADLAEDAGERDLALAALDRLLAIRPQDSDAALRRFALDPDRGRALRDLADAAESGRSLRRRAFLLARAATAALAELRDRALSERLVRRARAEAERSPAALAEVDRLWVDAVRTHEGPASDALLPALRDASASARRAGDGAAARAFLAEAVDVDRARGLADDAARDLRRLEDLAAADRDLAAAADHALDAGLALRDAGDLAGAVEALRRAVDRDPARADAWALLEETARGLGRDGLGTLADALGARAARARGGPERGEALTRLAATLALGNERERAVDTLRAALAEDPGNAAAEDALVGILGELGRAEERARILAARADRTDDDALRAALLREAAVALAASADPEDRARAAAAWAAVADEHPEDVDAARAAAALLLDLGRREAAIPHLAAIVRADPDDDDAARELAAAWAGRHRERAELFLARAERARGEPRAQRLREAAKALFAAGEDRRARGVLRDAFDAWPADDAAFFAAIRDAAADVDRLDAVLAARAAAVPAEAAGCHRARADALLAFGRTERAIEAYHACVALDPGDPGTLAALAACLAQTRGDAAAVDADERLVALAAEQGNVPPAVEAESRYRLGLSAWDQGLSDRAVPHLDRAVALGPTDPRAARALDAIGQAHAARGDDAGALAAARRRADRAAALGIAEERRAALEAGAALAARVGDRGEDAAAILEGLLALRAAAGEPAAALAPLAGRAAAALRTIGAEDRAVSALSAADLSAGAGPGDVPEEDLEALEAALEAGPDAPGFAAAAETLARRYADRGDFLAAARVHARSADGASGPEEAARAWLASAAALDNAGGDPDAVRAALDLATDADPDAPAPWSARAAVEARAGDGLAAARAWLAVAIRTEEAEAARAALEAARLFEEQGLHEEAARAYRIAVNARPGCVPARRVLAEEALAAGDAAGAADHLSAIPLDELPPETRPEHARALARALEAAGRAREAEATWAAVFRDEPGDPEVFARLGGLALARGGLEGWLDLAAQHDTALASIGDDARRRDLRLERGRRFAELGRLEAARGALLAALEIDPTHRPTLDALGDLDGRTEDWAASAAALAGEAEGATDRAEAAALLLRRARILADRLADPDAAVAALQEALVRARLSDAPATQRIAREAEALLAELGAPVPAGSGGEGGEGDPVVSTLHAQAAEAEGPERASLLERLASHLERAGDRDGTADALLDALEADPSRELTWSWLVSLVEGDPGRLERAQDLRARARLAPIERAAPSTAAWPEPPVDLDAEPGTQPISFGDIEAAPLTPTLSPGEAGGEGESRAGAVDHAFPDGSVEWQEPETAVSLADAFSGEAMGPDDLLQPIEPRPDVPGELSAEGTMAAPGPDLAAAALAAQPAASPAEQARLRRQLARQLEDGGDLDGAFSALLGAHAADPGDGATAEWLGALAERLGRTADAISFRERAIEAMEDPRERAARLVDLAGRAEGGGLRDTAVRLLERARTSDPHDAAALGSLARLLGEAREGERLLEVAAALEAAAGPEALVPLAGALGRAHLERGESAAAYARLSEGLEQDPSDLTLARDLSRAAEKLGRWTEYVRYGEVCADAIAHYDPLAAAARYRHFAEVLRDRMGDRERAQMMLEKALARAPDDPDAKLLLLELRSERPEATVQSLEGWLETARSDPSDARALSQVDGLARSVARGVPPDVARRLLERARIAAALAAWAAPGRSAAPAVRLAAAIPVDARERAATPGANGPLSRLLSLLTPWLEPLFPADLSRRGASAADRIAPPRAPALRMALEGAGRALGGRPHAAFLVARDGVDVALENTRPPSVVATAGVERLPEGALHFLAARAIELLDRGWALAGKFAPEDVGILLELACRFAGGRPSKVGLAPERSEAFLAALSASVPTNIRERAVRIGRAATEELAGTDPRAFATALRRTANRVALLYAGDPGGALEALARLDGAPPGDDAARALARPDLRDLALFALSDPFLDLRLAVIG